MKLVEKGNAKRHPKSFIIGAAGAEGFEVYDFERFWDASFFCVFVEQENLKVWRPPKRAISWSVRPNARCCQSGKERLNTFQVSAKIDI